jgi:hypothetical protein
MLESGTVNSDGGQAAAANWVIGYSLLVISGSGFDSTELVAGKPRKSFK